MFTQCRKCPYFTREKDKLRNGHIVLGFCRLRQKHITDTTINRPQCKERAVMTIPDEESSGKQKEPSLFNLSSP
ncbi:MAG: hypothetical protein JXC85_04555 [Candidatus Aenigmarchaeota archaeon]|nr:hypothetical protein [Candidatus Aenigmarchaeota archaeon]